MVDQYLAYKKHIQGRYDLCDTYEKKVKLIEAAYALKAPAMEAAYALHDNSALKFFNCLVPLIKEHISIFSISCTECKKRALKAGHKNLPLSAEQMKLQIQLQTSKMPRLQHENERLREENAHLKKDMEIVDWYI